MADTPYLEELERLLASALEPEELLNMGYPMTASILEAAPFLIATAREVEGLRERNDALALQADEWEGKYSAVSEINEGLRAEVVRMRAGLDYCVATPKQGWEIARRIARAALEGKGG